MELQFAVTDRDAFTGGRVDQGCLHPAHPLRDLERQAPPDHRKEDDEQAAAGPTHPSHRHDPIIEEGRWSGRPDSNRRRQAWEACILPLNYARMPDISITSPRRFATGRYAVRTADGPRRRGTPGSFPGFPGGSRAPPPAVRRSRGEPP